MAQIPTSIADLPPMSQRVIDAILERYPSWFVTHQRERIHGDRISRLVFNSPGEHPPIIIESAANEHRVFHLESTGGVTHLETGSLRVATMCVKMLLDETIPVTNAPRISPEV